MGIMIRYQKLPRMQYVLVSNSPHLYLDKNNVLMYSSRRLKSNKANEESGSKKHLSRFAIVDATTGCLYLEYLLSSESDAIYGFLYRAWKEKTAAFPFCGIPDSLIVMPRLANDVFLKFLEEKQIKALNPESGFAAGIRIFRSFSEFEEYNLADAGMWITDSANWPLDLKALNQQCHSWIVDSYNGMPKSGEKKTRFEIWKESNKDNIRMPDNFESFIGALPVDVYESAKQYEEICCPNIIVGPKRKKETAREKAEDILDTGMEYFWIGEYKKAMKEYRRSLTICPSYEDAHIHIGILLLERYKIDLAENCFRKAIELWEKEFGEPDDGDGWVFASNRPYMRALQNLGLTLEKKKAWKEALECYLALLRLNPSDNQGIRYLIGHVYHRLGDWENAEKRYVDASDQPEGAWNLVYLYFQREMQIRAVEAVIRAIQVNKHVLFEILYPACNIGEMSEYVSSGSKEQAIAYCRHFRNLWIRDGSYLDFLRKINSQPEVRAIIEKGNSTGLYEFEIRNMAKRIYGNE